MKWTTGAIELTDMRFSVKTAQRTVAPAMLAMLALLRIRYYGQGPMANLMVRNVDAAVVNALKALAGKRGTSAEAEHRRILAQALRRPKKKTFAQVLTKIPPVGKDSDFKRVED